jgi:cytochrome c
LIILNFLVVLPAASQTPNLGAPLTEADIAGWSINVLPSGRGLPAGSGVAATGAKIYAEKCVACHGENGKGGSASAVISDMKISTINGGEKTIANFWPVPTTLFDYIRRAMPWQQPKSLTDDEVYALVAYIYAANKLIGENEAMNAQTLPKVRMPNRDGFIVKFPSKM